MVKRKTVLKGFDYMHCDDFASYLNKMAAKGWHFKEWRTGLVFEKGEPESSVYAVEVFSEASENDTRPSPTTKEFAEYCEAAGWKLIDGKQKFCIFKKIQEDAVPILTDVERVNNAFKASFSGNNLALLILYAINAGLQWFNLLSFFDSNIFSRSSLYSLLVWNSLFILYLCKFIYAIYIKYRYLHDNRQGVNVYIGTNKNSKFKISALITILPLTFLIILLLYDFFAIGGTNSLIIVLVIIGSSLVVSWLIGRFRPDTDSHIIIQIVYGILITLFLIGFAGYRIFSTPNDEPASTDVPLLISDYKDSTSNIKDIDIYHNESLFGYYDTYFVWAEDDSLSYTVYFSKYDWILNKVWNDELERKVNENVSYCSEQWEADLAFKNSADEYLVRYDDSILIFREYDEIDLSDEQINIIRTKLNLR